jgi:hypothetical protein
MEVSWNARLDAGFDHANDQFAAGVVAPFTYRLTESLSVGS